MYLASDEGCSKREVDEEFDKKLTLLILRSRREGHRKFLSVLSVDGRLSLASALT